MSVLYIYIDMLYTLKFLNWIEFATEIFWENWQTGRSNFKPLSVPESGIGHNLKCFHYFRSW